MSVRVMSLVWDDFPGGGSELLALLALADWSDDEGRCYPSVAAIADKTRLSRSQAQRVVHNLIGAGFVSVEGNENGGRPGSTRRYLINLQHMKADRGRTGATGSAYATGRTDAAEGPHGCEERGRTHATQTVSEPSLTVRGPEQAPASPKAIKEKAGATLQAFLATCKGSGEKPIPEDDPIFDYAEKVGIEADMLATAWQEFKARFLPTAKRQKDWRAHFRNAVRRNWYGLWFLKEGEAARWTTAGEQARRAAA